MYAVWLQGFALPCAESADQSALFAICSCFAIIADCSTFFRSQIYYPALPTLVGSHNQVSTVLGKYFVCVMVSVGGHWQGWFLLTGLPWKPLCCALYLHGAPTDLSWHQFPSSSIGNEFNIIIIIIIVIIITKLVKSGNKTINNGMSLVTHSVFECIHFSAI